MPEGSPAAIGEVVGGVRVEDIQMPGQECRIVYFCGPAKLYNGDAWALIVETRLPTQTSNSSYTSPTS